MNRYCCTVWCLPGEPEPILAAFEIVRPRADEVLDFATAPAPDQQGGID